jgi:hypothetical protein
MIPQGSLPLNTAYFESLRNRIDSCSSCEELQDVVAEVMPSIQAFKDGLDAQMEKLAPMLALASVPDPNPAAIVSWITSLITNLIQPMIIPYTTSVTQLALLVTEVTTLTTAITEAQARFPSCSVSVPPIA